MDTVETGEVVSDDHVRPVDPGRRASRGVERRGDAVRGGLEPPLSLGDVVRPAVLRFRLTFGLCALTASVRSELRVDDHRIDGRGHGGQLAPERIEDVFGST